MIDLKNIKKVLTFFAHPDDETLAAGATIKKLTDLGIEVHVAIPATGVKSRSNTQDTASLDSELIELRQDTEKALAILGIPSENIYLGDFPDNQMDKHSLLEVIYWLEKIINRRDEEVEDLYAMLSGLMNEYNQAQEMENDSEFSKGELAISQLLKEKIDDDQMISLVTKEIDHIIEKNIYPNWRINEDGCIRKIISEIFIKLIDLSSNNKDLSLEKIGLDSFTDDLKKYIVLHY